MIRVTHMTDADIPVIAASLTAFETDLIRDSYGLAPAEAMQHALSVSELSCVLWNDGDPLLAFGVHRLSLVTRSGMVWMIGTRHIPHCRFAFARATRLILANLLKQYDSLANVLDCRDPEAVKWAKWLGARLGSRRGHHQEFICG